METKNEPGALITLIRAAFQKEEEEEQGAACGFYKYRR